MTLHKQQACSAPLSLTFFWAEEGKEEIILLQSRAQASSAAPAVVKEPGEWDQTEAQLGKVAQSSATQE